jgi:ZIP family zinc transporter
MRVGRADGQRLRRFVGANKDNLRFAFLGGLSGFAATAVAAVVAIALRDIAARTQDIMLGFAAGLLLAASSFSLILPGIEAARKLSGNSLLAASIVVLGLALGVALMIGLDRFVPHDHEKKRPARARSQANQSSLAFCLGDHPA